ncbi:DUF5615 family PIN-like protein [Sorangium sp. So ce117]|uniref:DUF5615 family PIN-like protein n=1 Tax=Sorangium sp. So ce117 TaxID=3133277 RepID=UPI003F5E6DE1
MNPLAFPLLADENIHREVVRALVLRGKDVRAVLEEGMGGRDDIDVLRHAHGHGRVVLTHDGDFGTLAYQAGEPLVGIIYLRPGHISPTFVIEMLEAIEASAADVEPPFVLVAERKDALVRVRVRCLRPAR